MTLRPDTESFLDSVERHARKKFSHRYEIGMIIESSKDSVVRGRLDDLIFYSKFLSRAYDILKRPNINPNETEKLSREFSEKLDRVPPLIRTITAGNPAEVRDSFAERFLSMSQDSVDMLMSLLRELSWVKHYLLDDGRLP